MNMRNLMIVGSVCVLMVCGVVSAPAAEQEPIKIGCAFAITGPASWLGEPEAKTVQMIIEDVNANGGINGRPVELIVEDTQGDETRTVNAVKGLIRQDVVAIVGPSRSGTTLAVVELCEKMGVPLISCAAASKITDPVKKYVFKTPHKDSHAAERIFMYMKAKGMDTVALITGTTGFGAAGREQLLEKATEYDIKVLADETYGPKDTDMTAQLTKIKEAGPQAIVNWSIVPAQSTVLKNARQLEMKQQFFQSHGFGNINYVKAAGAAANGVVFPGARLLVVDELQADDPVTRVLKEYKEKYESTYDTPVSTFGGHARDAVVLVLEGLEQGGMSRDAVRDYIENRKQFYGTGGEFNFSPEDHTGLDKSSFAMITVKDGKFVLADQQ